MSKRKKFTNNRKPRGAKKQFKNARYSSPGGAGGCGDLTEDYVPLPAKNQHHLDHQASRLYFTDWQAKKIINIPVDDMLRNGWSYDGLTDEQNEKLTGLDKVLDIGNVFRRAMIIERLMGGAAILMGIKSDEDRPEIPLDGESVKEGDLTFLNVIPRRRIHLQRLNNNVFSPDFGKPEAYTVDGKVVHESRLIVFDGRPLTYVGDDYLMPSRASYQIGFGQSELLDILDDLSRSTATRQAAFQLVNRASTIIGRMDFSSLAGTEGGEEVINGLKEIMNQLNIYNFALVDGGASGDEGSIDQLSASFGSVPELLMSFLQVLSAAKDIPATRFLGQAPGGLNATGEGDLENYYGRIESDRGLILKPNLEKLIKITSASAGVPVPKITFDPLWTESNVDKSQVRAADSTSLSALVTSGVISESEAFEQAKEMEIIKTDIKYDAMFPDGFGDDDDGEEVEGFPAK